MRAARGLQRDLAQAVGAFFGRGSGGSLGGGLRGSLSLLGRVQSAHNQKQRKGNDQEIQQVCQKRAVVKGDVAKLFCGRKREGFGRFGDCGEENAVGRFEKHKQLAEVGLKQQADQRCDQVVDQGGYDGSEGAADNNADCHVHGISLKGKLFKFFQPTTKNSFILCFSYYIPIQSFFQEDFAQKILLRLFFNHAGSFAKAAVDNSFAHLLIKQVEMVENFKTRAGSCG